MKWCFRKITVLFFFYVFTLFTFVSSSFESSSLKEENENPHCLILSVRSPAKVAIHEMLGGMKPEALALIAGSLFFSEEEKSSLTHFFNTIVRVEDYRKSGNLEVEAYNLYQAKPFQRVIAFHEYDLLRAAKLREFFGITEGQNYQSALAFRDKILMKEILAKKGVRLPAFKRISSPLDIIEFSNKHFFPVIVKPILGTGSDRATVLRNLDEVKLFIRNEKSFNDDYLTDLEIESFVEGVTYHVEGFVQEGKMVAAWPSVCINHSIDLNKGKYLAHHHLSSQSPMVKRLQDYTQLILDTLPTPKDTAFLLEVFHQEKNDEIVFCEIATRVGGGVKEMWTEDFSIDPEAEFLRQQAGLKPQKELVNFFKSVASQAFPKAISGWIIFPKLSGTLVRIPQATPFSWVKTYLMKVQPGTATSATANVSDSVASAFLTANSEGEFKDRIATLVNWFNQETQWMPPKVPSLQQSALETCCNICVDCDSCQGCDEIIINTIQECCKVCCKNLHTN